MKYPDTVTILRPSGVDEYGNKGSSWVAPEGHAAVGFLSGDNVFMPPGTDVQRGDRLQIGERLYNLVDEPNEIRSPSRTVMVLAKVERRL